MSDTPQPKNGKLTIARGLELVALVFSVIASLLTSSLVIFKGGALVEQVGNHETRLTRIEASGSPPISEHVKLDDAREARTRDDIREMKDLVAKYSDMGARLEAMNLKLELLREQLSKK